MVINILLFFLSLVQRSLQILPSINLIFHLRGGTSRFMYTLLIYVYPLVCALRCTTETWTTSTPMAVSPPTATPCPTGPRPSTNSRTSARPRGRYAYTLFVITVYACAQLRAWGSSIQRVHNKLVKSFLHVVGRALDTREHTSKRLSSCMTPFTDDQFINIQQHINIHTCIS